MCRSESRTSIFAGILLSAFLMGGLTGPVLHDTLHSLKNSCLEATFHCDHARHGTAYEPVEEEHDTSVCVLCPRVELLADVTIVDFDSVKYQVEEEPAVRVALSVSIHAVHESTRAPPSRA